MRKIDRYTIIRAFAKQYKKGPKKIRGNILNQLKKTTGYSRNHLGQLLLDIPRKKKIKRNRISEYCKVLKPLRILWAISNYACGQRLKPIISSYIAALRRHNELIVSSLVRLREKPEGF